MKKSIVYLVLVIGVFGGFWPLKSQAQFFIEASIRPRAEYRYGLKELAQSDKEPLFIVSQRTRLGINYQSDKIKGTISLQDVRVWGDESQVSSTGVFGDEASIDLAESWLSFNFSPGFGLKAGRQALIFDDERLIAKRNWNQHALFYDALVVSYQSGDLEAQMGFSYNNSSDVNFLEPYNSSKMKTLGIAHFSRQMNPHFKVSVITLFSGISRDDTTLTVYLKESLGLNLNYEKDRWKLSSSLYYQFGKDAYQGLVKNTSAYNLNLLAEYNFDHLMLQGGFSLLSGDRKDDAANGKTHLFDLLYGARHKYYGYLDYFSNMRKSTKNGGLNDFFATIGVPLVKDLGIFGTCHAFYLNEVPSSLSQMPNGSTTSYLSTELDFWFKADFWKVVDLQGGYSFMLPGHQLKVIQNAGGSTPFSSWAWIMVTVSLKSNGL